MFRSNNELRKVIREALEKTDFAALAENIDSIDDKEILDWMRFEEFGTRLLAYIGYKRSFREILYNIKREVETEEGWHFDY